jgi:hypothetical protein
VFSCGFLEKSGRFGRLIVVLEVFRYRSDIEDLCDQLALLNTLEAPVLIVPAASVAIC